MKNNGMKKVLLVNPPPDYDRDLYKKYDISMGVGAPFALVVLGTVLKHNGFEVRIIDGQVCDCQEELQKELTGGNVLCVGFTVMSSQYQTAAALSRIVKQLNGDVPVIWGGFHPTILPEETIRNSFVDYLVVGEGDKILLQFCTILREGGSPVGLGSVLSKQNGEVIRNTALSFPLTSLAELPPLDWKLLDNIEQYIKKQNVFNEKTRFFSVISGLGCNFVCSFCHNAIHKKKHRTRSATALITEMNQLHEQYGITEFGLVDENFFGDRERLEEFLQLLENNRYKFKWSTCLRASYVSENYLNKEMLTRIAHNGGYYFGVGAESGSEVVLKKLKKGITIEQVLRLAEWTRDIDITIAYSFIAGIPGESCAMTLETYRLIERIKEINPRSRIIGPQIFRPYPGSPLYDEAVVLGLEEPADWNDAEAFLKMLSQFKKIDTKILSWHEEPYKFKYMMLSFYLLDMRKRGNFLVDIGLSIMKSISKARLRTGFYSWFLEKPVLDYVNKRLS